MGIRLQTLGGHDRGVCVRASDFAFENTLFLQFLFADTLFTDFVVFEVLCAFPLHASLRVAGGRKHLTMNGVRGHCVRSPMFSCLLRRHNLQTSFRFVCSDWSRMLRV